MYIRLRLSAYGYTHADNFVKRLWSFKPVRNPLTL